MILYDGTLLCKRTYCQDDGVFQKDSFRSNLYTATNQKFWQNILGMQDCKNGFFLKSMHMPTVINYSNQFIWQNVFWRKKKRMFNLFAKC